MGKHALIIIGMHRSGTSAVSGLLKDLGVFMGSDLFGPQKGVNEKGFIENSYIVKINETLFDERCTSWDDPLAHSFEFPNESSVDERFVARSRKIIQREYGRHQLWGMKDPRTTLNLTFWQNIFSEMEIKVHYLMMLRHPLEVASSLEKRDSYSLRKSLMLWLNYSLASYLLCPKDNLYILNFDKLLHEPKRVATELSEKFNISFPSSDLDFVDSNLKNQKDRNAPAVYDKLVNMAVKLYSELDSVNPDANQIDAVKDEYREFLGSFDDVLKEHLMSVKKEEVHFRRLFDEAYYSYWWKISTPFRKIEKTIVKKFNVYK